MTCARTVRHGLTAGQGCLISFSIFSFLLPRPFEQIFSRKFYFSSPWAHEFLFIYYNITPRPHAVCARARAHIRCRIIYPSGSRVYTIIIYLYIYIYIHIHVGSHFYTYIRTRLTPVFVFFFFIFRVLDYFILIRPNIMCCTYNIIIIFTMMYPIHYSTDSCTQCGTRVYNMFGIYSNINENRLHVEKIAFTPYIL